MAERWADDAGWSVTAVTATGDQVLIEDTAVDNVSSPKPRSRRGYSEDTQIGAGDNGGYTRGRHGLADHAG